MKMILDFYFKVLDGPLYVIVSIICIILICGLIGYMGENYLNNEKGLLKEAEVSNDMNHNI